MAIEIKAPSYPESVQEGTLSTWHVKVGDSVTRDELIMEIETDKVVLEVVAPATGKVVDILKKEGDIVLSNELVALIEAGAAAPIEQAEDSAPMGEQLPDASTGMVNPSAKKLADERGINLDEVAGTGKGGRITKEDIVNYAPTAAPSSPVVDEKEEEPQLGDRIERRVAMTRMRSRISERLLEVTHTTASLTTFNEVDMSSLMGLRAQYQTEFTKMHDGTRLGYMGFFVKAAVEALKRFPLVNASIDGKDIVITAIRMLVWRCQPSVV